MSIRKGRITDLPELQEKFRNAKGLNIYTVNSKYMYVFEENGEIIAFLYGDVGEISRMAILCGLEVLEKYRHKKIATTLINTFETDLKKENYIGIFVFYNDKYGLSKFYEKNGFKEEDTLTAKIKDI